MSVKKNTSIPYDRTIISVSFVLVVGVIAWFGLLKAENHVKQNLRSELEGVLNLTREALHYYIQHRIEDLRFVAGDSEFDEHVKNLLKIHRQDNVIYRSVLDGIRKTVQPFLDVHGDLDFYVITPGFYSIASGKDNGIGIMCWCLREKEGKMKAIFEGKPQLILPSSPNKIPKCETCAGHEDQYGIFIGIPIYGDSQESVVGALLIKIDPSQEFTDIVNTGKVWDKEEHYVFDRSGRTINNCSIDEQLREIGILGQNETSSLTLRLQDPGGNLLKGFVSRNPRENWPLTVMAQSATQGQSNTNVTVYRDIRGIPVVGSWIWEKEYGFGLGFEVDAEEAYQPFILIKRIAAGVFCAVIGLFTVLLFSLNKSKSRVQKYARETTESYKHLQLEIIERENTEQALRGSEGNFRNLAENSPAAIMIVQDGCVVYGNVEVEILFGEDIFGPLPAAFNLAVSDTIYPADRHNFKKQYQRFADGEIKLLDIDFRVELGNHTRWLHCMASSFLYNEKEAQLYNLTDITRVKELEHIVTIKDKMSSLGRIATGIAHEIRNPLSTINVYLDCLKDLLESASVDRENAMETIAKMEQASFKVEKVVSRVMDFARPACKTLSLTDVNLCISKAVDLAAASLRKSSVSIVLSLDADLPKCYLDPHLMEQVFLNLISNAAEAMKENATKPKQIRLSTSLLLKKNKQFISITVEDSGPGIPADSYDKIFDPFFTTKAAGNGIGLSLCHRIITDQYGSLDVSRGEMGGALFAIEFPADKRKDEKIFGEEQ